LSESALMLARIESLAVRHERYGTEAYLFVLGAVRAAMDGMSRRRHLSGEELLETVKILAAERFGPMAGDVFVSWGIHETLDFGHIVFQLVDDGLLRKTSEDSLSDFADKFDFAQVFAENYFQV